MVDDSARERAIYQALKAAGEVAAALQAHLNEEHKADLERAAAQSTFTNSLTDPRVHYRRRVIAAAPGFLIGAGLLLAGVVINVFPIAVAGFVAMLACSLWAVTSYRRMTGITTGHIPARARRSGQERRAAKGGRAGNQARSGPMGRLEERWRRRQERGR